MNENKESPLEEDNSLFNLLKTDSDIWTMIIAFEIIVVSSLFFLAINIIFTIIRVM